MTTIRIIFSLIVLILSTASSNAQCSRVSLYNGPKTTSELQTLLSTSTDPTIMGLTDAMKQSLITYMAFKDGYVIGMSGADQNIRDLYTDDSYASAVLSAILGHKTIVTTYENKPSVTEISYDEFMSRYTADPTRYAAYSSWCKNCCFPTGGSTCCTPDGCEGCRDSLIIDVNTGVIYRVI